jgi:hypothetical protein
MTKINLDDRSRTFSLILFLIAIPAIIFLYFLNWKTTAAYGDDLYIYKEYLKLHKFSEAIDLPVKFGKYRPLHGMGISFIIELFRKNLNGYYAFNIAVQTINAFLFALIVNLFLRSPFFSLLLGLVVGLSRLFYFNIAQLLNGGALEGLATAFFLAFLYFLCKAFITKGAPSQKTRAWIGSIVCANLSMYTHERYIVLFPFIILAVFLSPSLVQIKLRTRVGLSLAAVISVIINVAIKKSIYSLPFFVGTASTSIEFSLSSTLSFFFDAILTLFQVNSGPEYLVGIPFSSLHGLNRIFVLIFAGGVISILALYFIEVRKFFRTKQKEGQSGFFTFLFLSLLGIMLLIPATMTIRLEQRWLEASFCIFILLVIIALNSLNFRYDNGKTYALLLFFVFFLLTDFNYLRKGVDNLSMSYSTRLSTGIKQAIDNGTISPGSDQLYIWLKHRNENAEQAIRWILARGYFFEFYQNKSKEIVFVDSVFDRSYPFTFSSFPGFKKDAAQIIYLLNNKVYDITPDYLQDSLKRFAAKGIYKLESNGGIHYDPRHLQIMGTDAVQFVMDGFYENQNGVRWTNGKASIGFKDDFITRDSLSLELNTYMPPVCANILPQISIVSEDSTAYDPLYSGRTGDTFVYRFFFKQPTNIQRINITSDTIKAGSGDARRLSFPFISLELNK